MKNTAQKNALKKLAQGAYAVFEALGGCEDGRPLSVQHVAGLTAVYES